MSFKAQLKRFQSQQFFRFYLEMNKPGVAALVNEKDKKVYVFSGRNLAASIARVAEALYKKWHKNKDLVRDRQRLELFVLCLQELSATERSFKVNTAMEEYEAQGYTLYDPKRRLKWTPKIKTTESGEVHVVVETGGKRNLFVEKFATYQQAHQYIEQTPAEELLSKARRL